LATAVVSLSVMVAVALAELFLITPEEAAPAESEEDPST